jgi:hypothetical protein
MRYSTSERSSFWLTEKLGRVSIPIVSLSRFKNETLKHPSPSVYPEIYSYIFLSVERRRVMVVILWCIKYTISVTAVRRWHQSLRGEHQIVTTIAWVTLIYLGSTFYQPLLTYSKRARFPRYYPRSIVLSLRENTTFGLHRYKPINCSFDRTKTASLLNRAVPLPDKEIRSFFPIYCTKGL